MRLDKYICKSTELTRNEAKKLLKSGEVRVDGEVIKNGAFKVADGAEVTIEGEQLSLIGQRYIMMNKPQDTICSNVDEMHPSLLHFLEIDRAFELHIAGRLDADTTGLVLITDDGKWSHNIISPKKQCEKTYRVWLAEPVTDEVAEKFAEGLQLHGENQLTLPAKLEMIDEREVLLTIVEGKYHQVKRMFAAVGNHVEALHRERIGGITLDDDLMLGEWRYLTEQEIALFL
ncbi:16S rRNA pseudouridine(516) synthase RsuA [Thalassotalea euphylliae]|uniref:Pseudouridine synthase n=1 Tax=Thalassotalea euphylliae TaxID=1655234 RepID=A0A3E0UHL1_9GAMM|nr:16S rRNA pseudouridine(516) synthase RsuA [Thalassotalea euphylliae]REL36087.1 16S rRNA pseudouridine(516) synthase RsuA [Thalassotalea euphylliae]